MNRGQAVNLDADNLRLTDLDSVSHKLAIADAIIWQTARQDPLRFSGDSTISPRPWVVRRSGAPTET